ncbi:MAG: hypothetical protein HQL01_02825 [Nitrospirae bacterium]|nr:hypothetical protein [Nitrospirota bacterium]
MKIGQNPAGVPINAAVESLNANRKAAKGDSKPSENAKAEKAATDAYTLGISSAKRPDSNSLTTIKGENEALDFATQAKQKITQNPNNAIGALTFNNSRVANLIKGLAESATV